MTKIVLLLSVVLTLGTTILAQSNSVVPAPAPSPANLKQPFGRIHTMVPRGSNQVMLVFTLRPGVTKSDVIFKKLEGSNVLSQNKPLFEPAVQINSTPFDCKEVANAKCVLIPSGDPTVGTFALPPRWTSFDLDLEYEFDGVEGKLPQFPVYFQTGTVPVDVRKVNTYWLGGTAKGSDSVAVVLNSDLDVSVKVRLKEGETPIAEGEGLLRKGSNQRFILKQIGLTAVGAGHQYQVEVVPLESALPVAFNVKESGLKIEEGSAAVIPFKIDKIEELKTTRILSSAQTHLPVKVTTNAANIWAQYNDSATKKDCVRIDESNYNCPLDKASLVEGINQLHVTGVHSDGRLLEAPQSIPFTLDTKVSLINGIQLTDRNQQMTVITTTDRSPGPFNLALEIKTVTLAANGTVTPVGRPILLPEPECQGLTCSFTVPPSDREKIKTEVEAAKVRSGLQLSIVLVETTNGERKFLRPLSVATFDTTSLQNRLSAKIDQNEVKQKLENLSTAVKDGKKDNITDEALKEEVKGVFNIAGETNSAEDQAIKHIVDTMRSKPKNKDRLIAIFKFIANVGFSYVGVPLRI